MGYWHRLFFIYAFSLYGTAACAYVFYFLCQKPKAAAVGFLLSAAGLIAHFISFFIRTFYAQALVLWGFYDSLSFFALLIVFFYLFLEPKTKDPVNGVFIMPLVFIIMLFAMFSYKTLGPVPVVLRSPWIGIHAGFCFISYSCFLFAFCFAVMYVWQEANLKSKNFEGFLFRLPSLSVLDSLQYRSVTIGFIGLTAGIITGSFWASRAWGSYWRWDPKQIWALVMWLVYIAYLHCRFIRGWRGKKSAYLAIAGFLVMLFTYFGVSFFFQGMHMYLG
jgi:cytochrome c-type biogenesis protein CcsB